MLRSYFYRNVRGRDLLDSFLVSAISSLLLVRFYLYLADYPKVGGETFHIAHMLWGGLLMLTAIVLMLSFLGIRTKQLAAIVGGVGFGVFIDELGKFITADNDYFFKPTVGLIYVIFISLYLLFNFLTRSQHLTSREYQINALNELEEAIAYDLDKSELNKINALLEASDQNSDITQKLRKFVDSMEITSSYQNSRLKKMFIKIDKIYENFWAQRKSSQLIQLFFAFEVLLLAGIAVFTAVDNLEEISTILSGTPTYGKELLMGQIVASLVSAGFIIYGLIKLDKSRIEGFEQFRRATLINIYLTQVFAFLRIQFDALPGLAINIVLLILISFVIEQETRLGRRHHVRSQR